jgi:hypothetical protein
LLSLMVLLRRRRADVVDELFSSVIKENAARAVHEEHPIVYEQVRNKWKRILEKLPTSTNETEQKSANPPSTAHTHNNSRGRGGTFVRGRDSFRGAQRGGHRPSFVVPQASSIMSAPKIWFLGIET